MWTLICPVSNVRIDRNVVRTTGFITTLCLAAYVYTGSPWIILGLAVDLAFRASMRAPQSPLARVGKFVAARMGLPYRAMDKAPKVFASRIGATLAAVAAVTYFVYPPVSPWVAGGHAVFAMLESVFDFCVGCIVYTYVALPLAGARAAAEAAISQASEETANAESGR